MIFCVVTRVQRIRSPDLDSRLLKAFQKVESSKKICSKFISEIKPAFGPRTNNVVMFVKNYDYGLAIIDLECSDLDKVSFKTSNLSLVKTNFSLG